MCDSIGSQQNSLWTSGHEIHSQGSILMMESSYPILLGISFQHRSFGRTKTFSLQQVHNVQSHSHNVGSRLKSGHRSRHHP